MGETLAKSFFEGECAIMKYNFKLFYL